MNPYHINEAFPRKEAKHQEQGQQTTSGCLLQLQANGKTEWFAVILATNMVHDSCVAVPQQCEI